MRYYKCQRPEFWIAILIGSACLVSAACDSSHLGDQWNESSCLVPSDTEELEAASYLLQVQKELHQVTELQGRALAVDPGSTHRGKPHHTNVIRELSHSIKGHLHDLYPGFFFHVKHYWLLYVILGIVLALVVAGRGRWWNEAVLADMPRNRRLSYFCFAMALGISLATLQFVGPVQNTVFMELVGPQQEPVANSMVFVILFPLVVFYGIAVTQLPSARVLVLAVCGVFMVPFFVVAVTIGVAQAAGERPPTWVAWLLYFTVESRNVILMPMIWSVVADVSTSELSKKAYPFIFFIGQICGMGGSSAAIAVGSLGGEAGLLFIQVLALMVIAAFTWAGCSILDRSLVEDAEEAAGTSLLFATDANKGIDDSTSFTKAVSRCVYEGLEGIWLLFSRPYVFMTFFVSNANLMTRTVMNYQIMIMVKQAYPEPNQQVAYFGTMTMIQNLAIALVTLLGTRRLVERLDVGKVLLILPIASTICIALLSIDSQLMMSTAASIAASTVAYSLNSPCKEILFVYTSRNIKYKAKSWSDMYGNHLMKLLGAIVNISVNRETYSCRPDCFKPGPTLVVAGIWFAIWIAIVLRLDHQVQELDSTGKKIS
mmetsp:Transcript_92152/g.160079  ORF Transcript_92152/g.160079 Transcript_92152/m.160079 type:complete len:599 (-) Transcript_92152:36-1832(-)